MFQDHYASVNRQRELGVSDMDPEEFRKLEAHCDDPRNKVWHDCSSGDLNVVELDNLTIEPWQEDAVSLVKLNSTTVEFNVVNKWTVDTPLSWMQVIVPTAEGDICYTTENVNPSQGLQYTGSCFASTCIPIRIYVGMNDGSFGISDATVPGLCEQMPGTSKAGYSISLPCSSCRLDAAPATTRRELVEESSTRMHTLSRKLLANKRGNNARAIQENEDVGGPFGFILNIEKGDLFDSSDSSHLAIGGAFLMSAFLAVMGVVGLF
jgi:hypothetical protein